MKIGFISMPLTGHLNPMTALARKLQSRGHETVFIGVPDAGPTVRAAGLKLHLLVRRGVPAGSSPVLSLQSRSSTAPRQHAGRSKGRVEPSSRQRRGTCRAQLAETGVEALVLDTIHMYLEVVPVTSACRMRMYGAILNIDFSGAALPTVVPGPYPRTLPRDVGEIFRSPETE